MNARKPVSVVSPLRVFGAMLRHYRTRASLTQDQLGGLLGHLIECAARPNIVIQVIPASIGAHQGMSGNFVIADFADAPSVAYQDTAARGQILEDSDDLGAISLLWDTLHSEALPRSASVGLMKEVLATWT
jgi:hypothetical protein